MSDWHSSFNYEKLLEKRNVLLCGYEGILSRGITPILKGHGANVFSLFLEQREDADHLNGFRNSLNQVRKDIDCLIYLGPPPRYEMIPDVSLRSMQNLMEMGCLGLHLAVQHVLPNMQKKRSGTIVIVSSDYALTAVAGTAPYAASAAAMNAYIRAAAIEWAKYGIRANGVLAGFNTADQGEAFSHAFNKEVADGAFERYQPLERAGTVTDIANAVLFLSCGMSNFITGEMLPVDGGTMIIGHSQVWHPKGKPPFVFPRKEDHR